MNNSTLSEQLRELRSTRYAQVPRLRYVMQTFLASAKHSEVNRSEAQARILDWARAKWPGLVPPHAYEGKAFEHDQAGLRIAATSNEDGSLWAFRSEHLDNKESRTWVTEALVADLGPIDAIGVRNSCSTLSGEEPILNFVCRGHIIMLTKGAMNDRSNEESAQAQTHWPVFQRAA